MVAEQVFSGFSNQMASLSVAVNELVEKSLTMKASNFCRDFGGVCNFFS